MKPFRNYQNKEDNKILLFTRISESHEERDKEKQQEKKPNDKFILHKFSIRKFIKLTIENYHSPEGFL